MPNTPHLGLADEGEREAVDAKAAEVAARLKGIEAVLAKLDALAAAGEPASAVEALRRRHDDRRSEYVGTADERVDGSPVAEDARLQAKLIEAERRRRRRLPRQRDHRRRPPPYRPGA